MAKLLMTGLGQAGTVEAVLSMVGRRRGLRCPVLVVSPTKPSYY